MFFQKHVRLSTLHERSLSNGRVNMYEYAYVEAQAFANVLSLENKEKTKN